MSYYEENYRMPQGYLNGGGSGAGGGMSGGGGGMDPASAGMTGMMAGGPAGAALGVGGSFLMNYLNQRAQEEENRKKALQDAAQYQAGAQTNALNSMTGGYGRALGV